MSDTEFMNACFRGDVEAIRALLEKGADINGVAEDGMTGLMLAASRGDLDTVKFLLAAGADIHLRLKDPCCTALDFAAMHGYTKILEEIIAAGADTNEGNSALHTAVMAGQSAAVKILLDAGADANFSPESTRSMLGSAIKRDHFDIAKQLLDAGADVNMRYDGDELVYLAVKKKNPNFVRMLLDAGANADSALTSALMELDAEMIDLALRAGANANLDLPKEGTTPLLLVMAMILSNVTESGGDKLDEGRSAVKLLLEAGADADVSLEGHSVLAMAEVINDPELMDLLKRREKSENREDSYVNHSHEKGNDTVIHPGIILGQDFEQRGDEMLKYRCPNCAAHLKSWPDEENCTIMCPCCGVTFPLTKEKTKFKVGLVGRAQAKARRNREIIFAFIFGAIPFIFVPRDWRVLIFCLHFFPVLIGGWLVDALAGEKKANECEDCFPKWLTWTGIIVTFFVQVLIWHGGQQSYEESVKREQEYARKARVEKSQYDRQREWDMEYEKEHKKLTREIDKMMKFR